VRHVIEQQPLARSQRGIEAVVADDVTGQAAGATEPVAVCLVTHAAGSEDFRPVGHLQRVGHVAGGRDVEDRLVAVGAEYVEHLGDQHPGVDRHRLARLEVDGQAVFFTKITHPGDQGIDLVIRSGDVVTATEVDPLQLPEQVAELSLDHRQRPVERGEVLLA
jgi:hypothetical protein